MTMSGGINCPGRKKLLSIALCPSRIAAKQQHAHFSSYSAANRRQRAEIARWIKDLVRATRPARTRPLTYIVSNQRPAEARRARVAQHDTAMQLPQIASKCAFTAGNAERLCDIQPASACAAQALAG